MPIPVTFLCNSRAGNATETQCSIMLSERTSDKD
jgi:hypothetical protein